MVRLCTALALAGLAACGTTTDDRPRTIEYVTEAILAPTCGQAQCHSSFRQSRGDVFDTVVNARRSLIVNGLITFDSPQYDPAAPATAQLIVWITQTDPNGLGIGRMPYDQPLPNEDVLFLERYIQEGAPGAQCDPDANPAGLACNNHGVYKCTADWTFGDQIADCAGDCINGMCQ
jgi:hypothetical protein